MAQPQPGTVEYHLWQTPTNPVKNPEISSSTGKIWARSYPAIQDAQLMVHTYLQNSLTTADFDRLDLQSHDDSLRGSEACTEPNYRKWRIACEAGCENWFHNEISNVVLSAWARYPSVLQTSHAKPLSEEVIAQNVDATYSTRINGRRVPVIIGEFKRNLIDAELWQAGTVGHAGVQKNFAQELRGYANPLSLPLSTPKQFVFRAQ